MTRTAISPRLAIRIRLNICSPELLSSNFLLRNFRGSCDRLSCPRRFRDRRPLQTRRSQRNVPVLARRILVALVLESLERGNQARARVARHDYLVHIAEFGRLERVGKLAP